MDGNGRWANARGRPRTAGHIAGARVVRKIVEAAPDCGIGMLTLYAFSADNWARPSREVALLMRLFRRYLVAETDRCVTNDVRMRIIGRRDRIPSELLRAIERGLKIPPSEIPRPDRGPRIRPDPVLIARLERLKAARNVAAVRLELAPGVLCPNGTLEQIAKAAVVTADDLAGIPDLRRWQRNVMGEELLQASAEPATPPG